MHCVPKITEFHSMGPLIIGLMIAFSCALLTASVAYRVLRRPESEAQTAGVTQNCVGTYKWGPCSEPCGVGIQTKELHVEIPPGAQGLPCPPPPPGPTSRPCMIKSCTLTCDTSKAARVVCDEPCDEDTMTKQCRMIFHDASSQNCTMAC